MMEELGLLRESLTQSIVRHRSMDRCQRLLVRVLMQAHSVEHDSERHLIINVSQYRTRLWHLEDPPVNGSMKSEPLLAAVFCDG